MKRHQTLSAAVALTLSACPLFAQENQPTPPHPPQGEGTPRREGGIGSGGGANRAMPGIFGALDANRDGAIDNQELAHAGDVLRKLDRNGDGRITPDEMRPPGDAQRPQAGGERREEGKRPEGARRDGDRPQGPAGEVRRDGDQPRGPRADGPRDGERERGRGVDAPRDPRGSGDSARHDAPKPPSHGDMAAKQDGAQRPPSGDRPQAQGRGQHQGPPPSHGDSRFGQRGPRPDFERGNQRAPWDGGMRHGKAGPHGPMAMGPRMDDRRGERPPMGPEGFAPREFRNDLGARGPQGGPGQFHPPGPGADRQGPGQMQKPKFDGPRGGPQGPEKMRDGHGDRAPQGPRDHRDIRPQGPRPPDVQ